jgi:hypothetical protein
MEPDMLTNTHISRRAGRTDWTSIFAACGVVFAILMILVVHPIR